MKPLDPLTLPLSGTVVVEASAGTGKTFTLSNLYLRLIVEAGREVDGILVVTYTNAATAELRDRIRRRLRAALIALRGGPTEDDFLAAFAASRRARGAVETDLRRLEGALRGFDEAAIFTIHGFCQRMLHENAFESVCRFDAELVADQRPLCREIVEDHLVRVLHDAPHALVAHLQRRSGWLDELERLVAIVVSHPDVPVLPERPRGLPREELERAIAARREALREAARLWRRSRDEIVALLTTSPSLNRNSYRPNAIPTWAVAMDELLAEVDLDLQLFEQFAKFTPGALRSAAKQRTVPPVHPFFDACEVVLAADAKSTEWLEQSALRFHAMLVEWARAEVRRRHDAANTQSFDDLLHTLRDALAGRSGPLLAERIRERFPAALVDEFQDTDPVQYEILRAIYRDAPGPLLLIGDPKQAIYAFRGADVFAYLRARRDAGDVPHTLLANHRSDPGLVEAQNALFSRPRDPFLVSRIPFVPMRPAQVESLLSGPATESPPLEILFVPRDGLVGGDGKTINKGKGEKVVAGLVAAEISRLLGSGSTLGGRPLAPGDIAVICRTNDQATLVQGELRALGVPSVRHGDDSVFDSVEAEELEHVLRAVAEPGDAARLRRALATTVIGRDAAALRALQADEDGWDRWANRFRGWLDLWMTSGFMTAFRRLLDDARVAPRLLAEEGGERSLTNLLHLAELLQTESMSAHRGPLALVDWLAVMRSDSSAARELGAEAAEVRLESDALAVQLTTVHRSKGLEYGIVYCPFLWDKTALRPAEKLWVRFHADDPEGTLSLDIAPASDTDHATRCERAQSESLAEGLRLVYVALTRARHRCTIVWGRFSGAESSALAYLLHQSRAPADFSGDALAKWVEKRFKGLDDRAIQADLATLAAASEGRIGVRAAVRGEASRYQPGAKASPRLSSRMSSRPELTASWRTSSFSALVSTSGRLAHRAEEGVDHDALEATPPALGPASEAPSRPRVRLHDFPAGARAGQLVHDVLENLDFAADEPAIAAVVQRRAKRHGLAAAAILALPAAVRDVLETPLEPGDLTFRLAAVAAERTLREMPFTLPVAQAAEAALAPRALARAFAELGGATARAYAPRLESLRFQELRGYLTGFVDLILEHGGRWWIVDYKSNHLGPHPEDYRADALVDEMIRHHYVLQYHLYTVALHAHLRQRLPGYDYERHMGGALYLFVRGMSPSHPVGTGIFADRPGRPLIEWLASVFAGGARSGATPPLRADAR